jgi:hypothetical protein
MQIDNNIDGTNKRRSMKVELNGRSGYHFTVTTFLNVRLISLITKSDLDVMGELVYKFP